MQPGQGAGGDRAHQQGADQARGHGGGNPIQVGEVQAAVGHHLLDQLGQGFDMAAGGDFRHHAPKAGVLLHLGGHGTGQGPLVAHHGRRRLVTTCFEGQNRGHR